MFRPNSLTKFPSSSPRDRREASIIGLESEIAATPEVPKDTAEKPMHRLDYKTTPEELRQQAHMYSELSGDEPDPQLKRAFAGVAFALAQLSECMDRLDTSPILPER